MEQFRIIAFVLAIGIAAGLTAFVYAKLKKRSINKAFLWLINTFVFIFILSVEMAVIFGLYKKSREKFIGTTDRYAIRSGVTGGHRYSQPEIKIKPLDKETWSDKK